MTLFQLGALTFSAPLISDVDDGSANFSKMTFYVEHHWLWCKNLSCVSDVQLAANAMLGLLIGTIFYDAKHAQSAIQNR